MEQSDLLHFVVSALERLGLAEIWQAIVDRMRK